MKLHKKDYRESIINIILVERASVPIIRATISSWNNRNVTMKLQILAQWLELLKLVKTLYYIWARYFRSIYHNYARSSFFIVTQLVIKQLRNEEKHRLLSIRGQSKDGWTVKSCKEGCAENYHGVASTIARSSKIQA